MGNKIKPRKLDYQVLQATHQIISSNGVYSSKAAERSSTEQSLPALGQVTDPSPPLSPYNPAEWNLGTPGQRRSQGQTRCTCAAGRQKRQHGGEHVTQAIILHLHTAQTNHSIVE